MNIPTLNMKHHNCVLLFGFYLLVCTHTGMLEDNTVQIKQGKLLGKTMTSKNGRTFHSFLGVPYGKADVRFQAPEAAEPWSGTLNATEDAPSCKQYDNWWHKTIIGVEDCLTLNVYTPKLPGDSSDFKPFPVMVFIHGGGFLMGDGSSKFYGPKRLLNNDIVLVAVQYRVGPLGFLSTGDEAASGNFGLLDQALALKWVNANIYAFGGNPGKITIFGQSAGGASVIFHLLSPLSKGLFHSVIAQSGSAICNWAIQQNPLKVAQKIAEKTHCPTENTEDLVKCLRKKDADSIIRAANESTVYTSVDYSMKPVIENKNNGKFLTESPWKLFKEGRFAKVPLISGVTEDEGAYLLPVKSFADLLQGPKDVFLKHSLPILINLLTVLPHSIVDAVYHEYFQDTDFENQTAIILDSIQFISDSLLKSCNDFTVRLVSGQGVPVYMYVYDYATKEHNFGNYTGKPDVSHGIDLMYLFNIEVSPMKWDSPYTDEEMQFSANLINMWANFSDISNPTPDKKSVQWLPTPPDEIKFLRISDKPKMETGYLTRRMEFWRKIFEEEDSESQNKSNNFEESLCQH